VLNRANARSQIFENDQDYEALQRVIAQTSRKIPVGILAYCIMSLDSETFGARVYTALT